MPVLSCVIALSVMPSRLYVVTCALSWVSIASPASRWLWLSVATKFGL